LEAEQKRIKIKNYGRALRNTMAENHKNNTSLMGKQAESEKNEMRET
jgi:hypothetical protein